MIAEAIRERGYGSAIQLAEHLNVSPQTVSKWVSGQTSPRPERWPHIEDALELPRGYIAEKAGYPTLSQSAQEAAIAAAVAAATDQLQAEIADLRSQVVELRSLVDKRRSRRTRE